MVRLNKFLLIFVFYQVATLNSFSSNSNDPSEININKSRIQIGFGYDLLTNGITHPVFDVNSTCLFKEALTDIDLMSKKHFFVVESMNEYRLVDAKAMSSKFTLTGSFSNEYRHKKEILNFNDYAYLRVEFDHNRNKQLINNCDLHPLFVREINKILFAIRKDHLEKARYLAQFLVQNYGTHAITSSVLGASLFMDVFIEQAYYQAIINQENKDLRSIVISYFNNKYGLDLNVSSVDPSDLIKFVENSHHSNLFTIGGLFEMRTTASKWENSINEETVATIDKLGVELDKLNQLSLDRFRDLKVKPYELALIKQIIRENIHDYLHENTNAGCMKRNYRSFKKNSNVHDQAMCTNESLFPNEYYYGGVILSDSSKQIKLDNILTNSYHCAEDFKEILVPYAADQILTFCVSEQRPAKQVYFAGGYSNTVTNVITKKRECPKYFYARRLGESENFICESFQEIPQVTLNAIPFGGIFLNSNYEAADNRIVHMRKCPGEMDKEVLFKSETETQETIYICTQIRSRVVADVRKSPLSSRMDMSNGNVSSREFVSLLFYSVSFILSFINQHC